MLRLNFHMTSALNVTLSLSASPLLFFSILSVRILCFYGIDTEELINFVRAKRKGDDNSWSKKTH